MIVTISTTHKPATDLGFLLHKHPERPQSVALSVGTAHVFYPEATEERCTVALLLEVDPIDLARGAGKRLKGDFVLGQYVNDRPYAASSLLATAMKKVFSTAFAGIMTSRPELATTPMPLEITLPVLPATGGPELVDQLFSPLGWDVECTTIPLDSELPQWGDSRYVSLVLRGTMVLSDALSHVYVLIPVLDDSKHYWVGEDEIEKLMLNADRWLGDHPQRDLITRRYLKHQRALVGSALDRLAEVAEVESDILAELAPADGARPARRRLVDDRHAAVLAALARSGATRVADVGCGDGALLAPLLADARYSKIIGTDVSVAALKHAHARLHVDTMSEREREKIDLFQSSIVYQDARLAKADAIVLMEVIEHIDAPRLPAMENAVFGAAKPTTVVVTTPNSEYNATFDTLFPDGTRHHDHRFEFTREQFAAWAAGVCATHGYRVDITGIGDAHTDFGTPTQMAVFTRVTAEGGRS